jgi:peptidoglycan/xylan/chitin deacetylase (PgdA/CDA1 family)
MKAIIFLVTDWVREAGEPRPLSDPADPASRSEPPGFRTLNQAIAAARSGDRQDFLRASEVKAMAESGLFEFGSHTRSHQPCFASPRIKHFLLTASPHWTKRALGGDQVRPGIPLYEWASAVTVPRYRDDPQLREGLARFLEGQGGFAAVRRKGKEFWTRRLRSEAERLKRQGRGGEYENEQAAAARILEDLSASRIAVEEISGRPCRALSWPWGHHSTLGVRLAKQAGYQLGFTTQTGAVCPGDEALLLPRLRVSGRTRPATLENLLRVLAHPSAAKLARSLSRSRSKDGLLSPGILSAGSQGGDSSGGK